MQTRHHPGEEKAISHNLPDTGFFISGHTHRFSGVLRNDCRLARPISYAVTAKTTGHSVVPGAFEFYDFKH